MMEMHGDARRGRGRDFSRSVLSNFFSFNSFSLDSDLRVESICVCVILKCSFVFVF